MCLLGEFFRGDSKDFRAAWDSSYIEAGLCEILTYDQGQPVKDKEEEAKHMPNRLFHEFRKKAVRNLVRTGVPKRVVMMISCHETCSVFERYSIVNEDDLKKAGERLNREKRDAGSKTTF